MGTEEYLRRERESRNQERESLQKKCKEVEELKALITRVIRVAEPVAQNLAYHNCGHHERGTHLYEMVNHMKLAVGETPMSPDVSGTEPLRGMNHGG